MLIKSACTTLGRAAASVATTLLEFGGGKVDPVDVQAASVQRTADACTFAADMFPQHTKTRNDITRQQERDDRRSRAYADRLFAPHPQK